MIIIEPFKHYEVLHSLIRMVIASNGSATIITNDFCKNHITLDQTNSITWHIAINTEQAIKERKTLLQASSKILFTTIDTNSIFWKWKKSASQIFAYIHNGHSFFDLNFYRITSLSYQAKYGSYTLRGDYRQQKKILNQLTNILVPNQKIEEHLKSKVKSKNQHKIKTLPFAFPEFFVQIHQQEQVNITIPGTISNQLRDYQILIECLEKVDQAIKTPVRLTLLGRLKEVAIRTAFKNIFLKNIEVEIFPEYIDPILFEKRMKATDFLLLPIREKVIYKAHHEYRGKSSVSGNINDLIRYGLPAILPHFYPVENTLGKFTKKYIDANSLSKILIWWISDKTYNQLKKEQINGLSIYQKKVLESFSSL